MASREACGTQASASDCASALDCASASQQQVSCGTMALASAQQDHVLCGTTTADAQPGLHKERAGLFSVGMSGPHPLWDGWEPWPSEAVSFEAVPQAFEDMELSDRSSLLHTGPGLAGEEVDLDSGEWVDMYHDFGTEGVGEHESASRRLGDFGTASGRVDGDSETASGRVGGDSETASGRLGGDSETASGRVDNHSETESGRVGSDSEIASGRVDGDDASLRARPDPVGLELQGRASLSCKATGQQGTISEGHGGAVSPWPNGPHTLSSSAGPSPGHSTHATAVWPLPDSPQPLSTVNFSSSGQLEQPLQLQHLHQLQQSQQLEQLQHSKQLQQLQQFQHSPFELLSLNSATAHQVQEEIDLLDQILGRHKALPEVENSASADPRPSASGEPGSLIPINAEVLGQILGRHMPPAGTAPEQSGYVGPEALNLSNTTAMEPILSSDRALGGAGLSVSAGTEPLILGQATAAELQDEIDALDRILAQFQGQVRGQHGEGQPSNAHGRSQASIEEVLSGSGNTASAGETWIAGDPSADRGASCSEIHLLGGQGLDPSVAHVQVQSESEEPPSGSGNVAQGGASADCSTRSFEGEWAMSGEAMTDPSFPSASMGGGMAKAGSKCASTGDEMAEPSSKMGQSNDSAMVLDPLPPSLVTPGPLPSQAPSAAPNSPPALLHAQELEEAQAEAQAQEQGQVQGQAQAQVQGQGQAQALGQAQAQMHPAPTLSPRVLVSPPQEPVGTGAGPVPQAGEGKPMPLSVPGSSPSSGNLPREAQSVAPVGGVVPGAKGVRFGSTAAGPPASKRGGKRSAGPPVSRISPLVGMTRGPGPHSVPPGASAHVRPTPLAQPGPGGGVPVVPQPGPGAGRPVVVQPGSGGCLPVAAQPGPESELPPVAHLGPGGCLPVQKSAQLGPGEGLPVPRSAQAPIWQEQRRDVQEMLRNALGIPSTPTIPSRTSGHASSLGSLQAGLPVPLAMRAQAPLDEKQRASIRELLKKALGVEEGAGGIDARSHGASARALPTCAGPKTQRRNGASTTNAAKPPDFSQGSEVQATDPDEESQAITALKKKMESEGVGMQAPGLPENHSLGARLAAALNRLQTPGDCLSAAEGEHCTVQQCTVQHSIIQHSCCACQASSALQFPGRVGVGCAEGEQDESSEVGEIDGAGGSGAIVLGKRRLPGECVHAVHSVHTCRSGPVSEGALMSFGSDPPKRKQGHLVPYTEEPCSRQGRAVPVGRGGLSLAEDADRKAAGLELIGSRIVSPAEFDLKLEVALRRKFLMAAKAVDDGNLGLFKSLAGHLRPFAKPRGAAAQRWAHTMLEALVLKVSKRGATVVNRRPRRVTVEDLVASRAWCFRNVPFISWSCELATPMLVSRLLGHSRVHLICWSESFMQQVPVLIRILAGPGKRPEASPAPSHASTPTRCQSPSPSPAPSPTPTPTPSPSHTCRTAPLPSPLPCLEHLRLTVIDPYRLVSKRMDMLAGKEWGATEAALKRQAAQAGVHMEFQVLFPEAENMEVLDAIQPRDGELVAACCLYVMQRASEDPRVGGGARIHLMELLKRMRPSLVVFAETEEGSGSSAEAFLARFEACSAHYWAFFHAFEACLRGNDLKLLLPFESIYQRLNTYRIVSCDGPERLIRPLAHQSWQAWFKGWGFNEVPILPHVFTALSGRSLARFPNEFQTSLVNRTLWMSYKGRPLAHASCWV